MPRRRTTSRRSSGSRRSRRSDDKQKTFCIYDAPSPEAIRRTADRHGLPVDHITEVRVLDPYFYR